MPDLLEIQRMVESLVRRITLLCRQYKSRQFGLARPGGPAGGMVAAKLGRAACRSK
jgi:hypothetical protein